MSRRDASGFKSEGEERRDDSSEEMRVRREFDELLGLEVDADGSERGIVALLWRSASYGVCGAEQRQRDGEELELVENLEATFWVGCGCCASFTSSCGSNNKSPEVDTRVGSLCHSW